MNQINKTTSTITITIIPEYIQKHIIRILCQYINNHNSKFRSYIYNNNFEIKLENEKQVNKQIRSISMVNKLWLNTISNNLYVSNDFVSYRYASLNDSLSSTHNFNKDNESDHYIVKRLLQQQSTTTATSSNRLLKDENITELVLNIDLWDIKIKSSNIPVFLFKLINYTIKNRFINLKRISISNGRKYKYMKYIEFGYIRIRDCISDFTPLPSNIKEIDDLELLNGIEVPIEEAYKLFININSIKVMIYANIPEFNIKTLYETIDTTARRNDSNCFSKTTTISGSIVTIEDLYYLLKLAPGLKMIRSDYCVDNINYQLNKIYGNFNDSIVNVCTCCNQDKNENFLHYWNNVIQMLNGNKSLHSFQMNHECPDHENFQGDEYQPHPMVNELSIVFIDQFSSIFTSNKSNNFLVNLVFQNFKESNQFVEKINSNSHYSLNLFAYNGKDVLDK